MEDVRKCYKKQTGKMDNRNLIHERNIRNAESEKHLQTGRINQNVLTLYFDRLPSGSVYSLGSLFYVPPY